MYWNNTHVFNTGDGQDTINNYSGNYSGCTDVSKFGADIAADQLWFEQSGNDLEVSVIGTGDRFTISNWYSGGQCHIEQFRTDDGHVLADARVQNLMQAMAAFSPAAGQTTLPSGYQSALVPVIAANWQ